METNCGPSNGDNLPNEHPLLNSVVLKQVFQYLQPTDNLETLKTIRQVCTAWRDESLHWWRSTGVLKLTPDQEDDLNLPPYEVNTFTQLMGNLQNCYRFEDQPFQKYKLQGATIDIMFALEEGTFWTFLGDHVQHLTLDNVSFVTGRRANLMQFLVRYFPNLKSLTVTDVRCYEKERDLEQNIDLALAPTPALSSVTSLKIDGCEYLSLDNFPNLKNLTLEKGVWLEATKNVENSTVTNLTVNCPESPLNPQVTDRLFSLRFKLLALQNLSLRLSEPYTVSISSYLPTLLRSHGETLKTLQVLGMPFHTTYCNFPFKCQLGQLTELRLWGNVVHDLGFLKWTPKLKVLKWDLFCLERQEELRNCYDEKEFYTLPIRHDIVEEAMCRWDMAQVVLPDLEHLQLNCKFGFSMKSLKKLGEWMPNVKTLKIVLWPGTISGIADHWPLLEHLVGLYDSQITDDALIENGKVLLNLKTFHMYTACDVAHLTDAVVDSVFLKMRNLKDLKLCFSAQFSHEAEVRLRNHIPKVEVIRNYAENKEHVNWECCRNSEFLEYLRENAWRGEDSSDDDDDDDDHNNHHKHPW